MAIFAEQLTPSIGQDATIAENTPTTNDGSATTLFATLYASGDKRRILMKFPSLENIPAARLDSTMISSATISLVSPQLGTIRAGSVHRILQQNRQWNEFTTTWNTKDGTDSWAGSNGCGTAGTDYATTALGTWTSASVIAEQARTITITDYDELIEMARNNYGMIFVSDEGGINTIPIAYSSEAGSARAPILTINYYHPDEDIANDSGTNNYDGYHTANVVTAGDNGARYDGSTTYTDITTTGISASFTGVKGTVIAECLMIDATPQENKQVIRLANNQADPNDNAASIAFLSGTNTWFLGVQTDNDTNTNVQVSPANDPETDYTVLGISWADSANGDFFRAYVDGSEESSQTGLDVWDGGIAAATTIIGALNTTPARVFNGWIRNVIISWETATAVQHASIASAIGGGTLANGSLDSVFGADNWVWYKLNEQKTTPVSIVRGVNKSVTVVGTNDDGVVRGVNELVSIKGR